MIIYSFSSSNSQSFQEYVIIRGEILHASNASRVELSAKHVKLELMENHHAHIVDQIDFICASHHYPCPFEYLVDTARVKSHKNYHLEAIISETALPARKSKHQHHGHHKLKTTMTHPKSFSIDAEKDTIIENYQIYVSETE